MMPPKGVLDANPASKCKGTLYKRMKIDVFIDENQSPSDDEEHERRNREHGGSVGIFRLYADRIDYGGAEPQRGHD